MSKPGTRRMPRDVYEGKKGFRDWPGADSGWKPPRSEDEPDALTMRRHRLAQFVLSEKGSFVPSIHTIMKEVRSPVETLSAVNERTTELKKQHIRDLEKLFALQGEQHRQGAIDRYSAIDFTQFPEPHEEERDIVETHTALMDLHERGRRSKALEDDWDDALDHIRFAHLQTLLPLLKRKSEMEQRRDAYFPSSIQEYHMIRDRDIQLRVARFLALDSRSQQDKMLSDFNWVWRQVTPLLDEYHKNDEFRTEINEIIKDVKAADPRKRYL
ncbi:hypothetical protein SERLA73DRAFT_164301 [Serpula lacrymans var. lacrymans S7.3]|uniref:Uncharacterized protein n=2 Tax=Serpula lacrymans var. lacrymans TaxID=341189 RepID=F8QIG6_SERL3|nr:uncharacterized protein SERLADRAFT_417841 [Serpula lacrymans var. lacrymans S7.9]EGN91891.1 hypothetical protein SERLA73DRAFT_164301 [Serpula lacrymans var. lacrymans S7.3]EGO20691.1 hypothetical protein SERLADRAFT_417841 [Serpula lacrymans var. lacrymans S7.9]